MKRFAGFLFALCALTFFCFSIPVFAENYVVQSAVAPFMHALFPKIHQQKDEAMMAKENGQLSDEDYKKLVEGSSIDYFQEMDNGLTKPANRTDLQNTLSPFIPGITQADAARRAARGRNNWIVWTFGNDQFWSDLGISSFGGIDFLKTISTQANVPSARHNRWEKLGLVNEPCFKEATGPREDRWGLYLDERIVSADCPADPFDDPKLYPGIKIGARGKELTYKGIKKTLEVGSFYGYPTGVVGFRLFPNPDFDQKAADAWDPEKYYNDAKYYNDPKLVRPYRVGMACALCHVGPNPSHPPIDFNNPKWADLNSNTGAQYFWFDRVFMWDWVKNKDSFIYQLLHTSRPGTLDTSLVSSDSINNARTMNAVYDLPARITAGIKFNASELLTGDETLNKQFTTLNTAVVPDNSPLRTTVQNTSKGQMVISPRVLKDGSDSVGALGALNRVYVNIGLFGNDWVKHFIPLVGGPVITPFKIKTAEENSLYWRANIEQTPDLALFFLAAGKPDKLEKALEYAPQAQRYLQDFEGPQVSLGKKVFAESCARCHSSKLPEKSYSFFNNPNNCEGKNYLKCWDSYWQYSKTPDFKQEMTKLVQQKDFLDHNFMSTDLRIPVSLIDSQLCSPIATNAIKGDIWDNFSSTTYKNLPSIGNFTVNYPTDSGSMMQSEVIEVPGGGRGFLRPPSLISLWSTAPFLQNNSLGLFDDRGTIEGRMKSFDDSIHKLLNPETRANPNAAKIEGAGTRAVYYKTNFGDQLPGEIDVTTKENYLKIPYGYLPKFIFEKIKKSASSNPMAKNNIFKKGFEYVFFEDPTNKDKSKRKVASSDYLSANTDPKEMGNMIYLGPIPAGVPVNLISNIDVSSASPAHLAKLTYAVGKLVETVIKIRKQNLKGTAAAHFFMKNVSKSLLAVSKCNDFVVNRGHYFGTKYARDNKEIHSEGLNPEEKVALIEYLKHF